MSSRLCFVLFTLLLFAYSLNSYSQSSSQSDLELKRIELTKEINNIQKLISSSKNKKKLVVENIQNLNYKLDLQNEVIKIINNELNIISASIIYNQSVINQLFKSQELLKSQYADMILRSYKTRSKTGKLMFIFSSSNFQQALKRIQYFKQYSDYQNKQLQQIANNTVELKVLRTQLIKEKTIQESLIIENQTTKNNVSIQLLSKNKLLQSISSNEIQFVKEIKSKQIFSA